MATAVKTMSNLAIVINILLKMQADGLIQLLWIKERFFSVSTQWIGRVNNLSVVAATVDQHNSSVTDQFGMYHAFIVCVSCYYSVFHFVPSTCNMHAGQWTRLKRCPSNIAIVINILLQMQADGLIQLMWIKERFFFCLNPVDRASK